MEEAAAYVAAHLSAEVVKHMSESEYVAKMMSALQRPGGVITNHSCYLFVSDAHGKIRNIRGGRNVDGVWGNMPAPKRQGGEYMIHLQDNKFRGAEGTLELTVGGTTVVITFGCPLMDTSNNAESSHSHLVSISKYNKKGHPLYCHVTVK